MKSRKYSTISYNNNKTDDTISLGLLMWDDQKLYCEFSPRKLDLVKLFALDDYGSVEKIISDYKQILGAGANQLSDNIDFDYSGNLDSDFIQYLSQYENGVVKISPPANTKKEINPQVFKQLMNLLIDPTYGLPVVIKPRARTRVRKSVAVIGGQNLKKKKTITQSSRDGAAGQKSPSRRKKKL